MVISILRLEGVNDVEPNQSTVHTGPNCNMPATRTQTGTTVGTDCNANDNGNAGCGVRAPTSNSYGPAFNSNGGGFYAMERTNSFIRIWFFPRNAGNIPSDLSGGASTVDTDNWVSIFNNVNC